MKDRRLVIAGATSYIGARLTAHAHAAGADVVALGSRDCDLRDAAAVRALFATLADRPFTLIFLAVVNKQVANTYAAYHDNVLMVRNVVDGLRGTPLDAVIHFSSVDVYGRRPALPITEAAAIDPDTWYGLAKYTGEWMLRAADDVAAPVTVLRIPGIYGPAANDPSVIGQMARSLKATGQVRVAGPGRARRDYIYVADVARLVEALLPLRHPGVVNVVSGQSRSVREVAELVAATLDRPGAVVISADGDANREFDLVFDPARLRALVPDFAFTPLADGIAAYR